jgi:Na+-translocating ferredoxin:NAD+ oxidoreductase RnfD subunit
MISNTASASRPGQKTAGKLWLFLSDRSNWIMPAATDPRWIFVCFLTAYVLLGHFILSFNRSPGQIIAAVVTCLSLDMAYTWVYVRKLLLPLSALISACALAILFTAPGSIWLMLLASWLCITSKYLVTWRGRHLFNPANFAMIVVLFLSGGNASIAPAYQWGGTVWAPPLVLALGLIMMSRVNKLPLVLSFWACFVAGAFLRAYVMQAPITLTLWATASGGAFMLYSFFMITDPKTSPASTGGMIVYGAAIGLIDLVLQLNTAVFSMFYALAIVCACRGIYFVVTDLIANGAGNREAISARAL